MKVFVLQTQDLQVHSPSCLAEVIEINGVFPEAMLEEVIQLARKPIRTDNHDRYESSKGDVALFGLPRTDVIEFELGVPDTEKRRFSRFYNRRDRTFTEVRSTL